MSVEIRLNWSASVPVSCLYAAECVVRSLPLADSAVGEALAKPAARLQEALLEEYVPLETFWSHVVPLAANFPGQLELATIALTKTVGRPKAEVLAGRFRGLLVDVRNAYTRAVPESGEALAARIEPLRQAWNDRGTGLLPRMVNWTEPEIIVEEATVCLVHPILAGGGTGYLPYNLAVIEAVAADPAPELPEVLRLAWMLSTLNLDLPRYSEHIQHQRVALVAALAMIPVAVTAAADIRVIAAAADAIGRAVQAWTKPPDKTEEWTRALEQWWGTYSTMRPPWATALKGLDVLLS